MEQENITQENLQVEQKSQLHQVTPLSKYLAMILFIIMPFVGGYIGYVYAPEKVVEVEKVVIKEVGVSQEIKSTNTEPVQCVADSDCILVQPDCEDCRFAALSKSEYPDFQIEKKTRCELNPPKVMCDTVFSGDVKCIDNSCQVVSGQVEETDHGTGPGGSDKETFSSQYLSATIVESSQALVVNFSNSYSYPETYAGSRESLTIDFGDGRSGLMQDEMQHTYVSPGTYKVELKGCNENNDFLCEQIVIDSLTIKVDSV